MTKELESMKDLISELRKSNPAELAKKLSSVQPMDSPELRDSLKNILDSKGPSESELRAAGYRPVSHLGLIWIKD